MMLSELLHDPSIEQDVLIQGITEDSRRVRRGDLFVALQGGSADGRDFIASAVNRGAVAVLCDAPVSDAAVPVIEIPSLRAGLGEIAGRYYGNPGRQLDVIAVTGTNGKTSFTHLLAQALAAGDMDAGLIGTMGHGRPGNLAQPGLTTPGAIDLQRRLAELKAAGCAAVVIEASSHGLVQHRLNGANVTVGVFTNITHDHLDYHGSFSEYQDAKRRLFEMPTLETAVINLDDEFAADLIAGMRESIRVLGYSTSDRAAAVYSKQIRFDAEGLSAVIATPEGDLAAHIPLYGEFNLQNVLAVVATLVAQGWSAAKISAGLQKLTPVRGRMDVIFRQDKPGIIIDYAHTPDALEKCLMAVRQHFPGRKVSCVFGCGGDRDTAKRPLMGAIAAKLADRLYVTSDNPRSEDPAQILQAIVAGIEAPESLQMTLQTDREKAIRSAFADAAPDEVIVIAGKGHEDYQELAEGRVHFSDYDVVASCLGQEVPVLDAILGVGATGLSYARHLAGQGSAFMAFDSQPNAGALAALNRISADARLEGLDTADLTVFHDIYVSPGVPLSLERIVEARNAGVRLHGDIAMFADLTDAPFVVITGTNGKSTVAEMLYRIAADQLPNVQLGGNIGTPCLDLLDNDASLTVLEVSSYQLELAQDISADVAVVLNLTPDHEDRYENVQQYYDTKLAVYERCRSAVVNRNLKTPPGVLAGRLMASFGSDAPVTDSDFGLIVTDGETWLYQGDAALIRAGDLQVSGVHNLLNALAALACGHVLGLETAAMVETLKSFTGLPHRSEFIAEIAGVKFINDSKATNAGAMLAAVRGLGAEHPVHLIAGGETKGARFENLADHLAPFVEAIYLIGESPDVLQAALATLNPEICGSLDVAVTRAAGAARPGDIVLLSPGCASFDQFANYRERGDAFRRCVEGLPL